MKQKLKRFMAGFMAMLTLVGTLFTNGTTAFAASPQANIAFWNASVKNSGEVSELKPGFNHGKILYSILDGNSAYCMNFGLRADGGQLMNSYDDASTSMSAQQRKLLSYCLYYGFNSTQKAAPSNSQCDEYIATQAMVWVIVADIFGTGSGDSAARKLCNTAPSPDSSYSYYERLRDNISSSYNATLPSFASRRTSEAPTYELKWNEGSQRFETTLSDSNGVLSDFDFGISGYSVDKNGNSITISSTSVNTTATTGTFTSNAGKVETTSSCVFWLTGKSGYQEFISERPTADPVKAYIKVKTENIGYGELTKTDESSGVKLSGAVYGIYSDSGCTNRVQTMTTDGNGYAKSAALVAGTYYVKEITAPKGYVLSGTVHTLTVKAGQTTGISATDKEQLGAITIYKEGEVLSSWNGSNFTYEKKKLSGATFKVTAGADIYKAVCVNDDENFNMYEALNKAIGNIKAQMTDFERVADEAEQTKEVIPADPDVRNYTYTFFEGKLYYRENSEMNNVSGISSSGAKKSTDMQLKCQYLSEINDGRGIVFATGTPISNTMCEMYVMQLYLQKAALEEMGIYHFDSWAANFGEVTTALELTVEGSGFRFKSRFNKFTNLPELMNIFREVADVQTADMLDLDVPALRGGKPIIVESEPDWYVKQVMEDFVVRAERIRGGGVDPSVDNFLKITHEARLLGTDARLIDKDAPNNPDGKLNKVAENVWKEYEKGNANGHIGCQLIFSDIGTPGPDKDFTIYDYLKETLIQYGIPAEEIAFIHDAKTDAQRDALFKEMRTGKKKVLIGSTDKCGTGVNVQTHLVAMHHVDCPWKPSSIEQREGRGIRQGNENEEVAIYRYVTKGTFDAYNWSLVENKQRFISQVMTSKAVSRSCEDIDEATLSYAEIKAVATGNPLIKEKMEIDNDVQRLKLLKASYDNQRYGLQDNFMIKYPKLIKTATEKLANVREDVKARDKELIDNPEFAITIGKATYTERVDGGTMMLEAISKCKTGETTAIGKFHGFELLVEKNFLGINYMVLRGKTEYKAELSTSPVGSMVKLENLFNGLHENIDFLEKKIEQYQNDLEASKAEYDKPFAYSKELEEKLSRQCELNAQLDLENAKAVDADLSGPEEEREADDRMESAAIVAEDKGAYPADREGRTR